MQIDPFRPHPFGDPGPTTDLFQGFSGFYRFNHGNDFMLDNQVLHVVSASQARRINPNCAWYDYAEYSQLHFYLLYRNLIFAR